ncbi:hypothetical protein Q7P35_004730 [Cladosporium inversicolor]
MFNPNTLPSVGRMAVMATSFMCMANAHMYISEPQPLPGNAIKDPLDPSGSNFPCHGASLPSSGGQSISAGSTFPLKLELGGGANTAVHGGGSCQLSITYETDPVKAKDPKNWHVIYSIEGGCPSNTAANLDSVGGAVACQTNEQGDCVHSWDIPMPKGVNPGNAVLAWTWQNTLGNREFYMGCSAVSIEGGSGDEMNSLPAMFVANLEIEGGKCPTTASQDVLYPNPGQYVTTMSATNGKNWPKATPTGDGCAGGSAAQPTGYGSGSGPSSSAPAPSSSAYAQPTGYGAPGGYGAPSQAAPTSVASHISSAIASYDNQKGRETQTTFATSASVARPSSAAPNVEAPAPTGYSSGAPNSESNNTSPDGSSSSSCDRAGEFQCSDDGQSFSVCDQGKWVSMGRVSEGTKCSGGVIQKRSSVGRFRRHLHAHKH